jgi:hypothetical protein
MSSSTPAVPDLGQQPGGPQRAGFPRREGLQPRGYHVLIQLRGAVLAAEPGQKRQADRAVQLAEQADRCRERHGQVGTQLVAGRDPVGDQVLAGAYRRPQRDRRRRVRDQRPQPRPGRGRRVLQDCG